MSVEVLEEDVQVLDVEVVDEALEDLYAFLLQKQAVEQLEHKVLG